LWLNNQKVASEFKNKSVTNIALVLVFIFFVATTVYKYV